MHLKTILYDARLLRGDPMLMISMAVPFILWGILRFGFPVAAEFSETTWNLDLYTWFPHTGYFFMTLIPMMTGMVYGFILLDERDEGIISAISVTPQGKTGYLRTRLSVPMLLSFAFLVLFLVLSGLKGEGPLPACLLLCALMASQSLMILLFLGAFAGNKIVGLAISKGFGILLLGPLMDYIIPGQLKWAGAYSPMFWTGRAFLAGNTGTFSIYFTVALLYHSALILILYRIFLRRSD